MSLKVAASIWPPPHEIYAPTTSSITDTTYGTESDIITKHESAQLVTPAGSCSTTTGEAFGKGKVMDRHCEKEEYQQKQATALMRTVDRPGDINPPEAMKPSYHQHLTQFQPNVYVQPSSSYHTVAYDDRLRPSAEDAFRKFQERTEWEMKFRDIESKMSMQKEKYDEMKSELWKAQQKAEIAQHKADIEKLIAPKMSCLLM